MAVGEDMEDGEVPGEDMDTGNSSNFIHHILEDHPKFNSFTHFYCVCIYILHCNFKKTNIELDLQQIFVFYFDFSGNTTVPGLSN